MKIKSKFLISNIISIILIFIVITFLIRYFLNKISDDRIKNLKNELYNEKCSHIKNLVYSSYSLIEKKYNQYINNPIKKVNNLKNIQNDVIDIIASMRYDNGTGYFWINDTTKPTPIMIMHPIIPDLNNKILDDEKFNCAFGKKQNLFEAFVKVCEQNEEGYVDYLWPKPIKGGITKDIPKISFVKIFKPWGWIIGTGIYIDDIDARLSILKKQILKEKRDIFLFLSILTIIFLILSLLLTVLVSSGILKSLKRIVDLLKNISGSNGDLTKRIDVKSKDEIGILSGYFNKFIEEIHDIIINIKNYSNNSYEISNNLASSSEEVSATTEGIRATMNFMMEKINLFNDEMLKTKSVIMEINKQIKEDLLQIEEQSSSFNESSSSIHEMVTSINNIKNVTFEKQNLIINLSKMAIDGDENMKKTISSIETVLHSIDTISDIIKVINNVANQTNLLAMNANIEAAHAGEFGKGFSVVADEIRKLSETTTLNAKNISMSLKEIINNINNTYQSTKESENSINHVIAGIKEVADSMNEISNGMDEMAVGSKQIIEALNILIKITENVRLSSKEMDSKTNIIENSIIKISDLSNENKMGITDSTSGVNEISKAMLYLTELSTNNAENIQILEKEVLRFKTKDQSN